MSVFKNIIGKRVNGIFLGDDNWTLVLRTIDGKYYRYNTSNDCCNSVWINHMSGIDCVGRGNSFDLLRGALVTGSEDKEWTENRYEDDYEVVQDGFYTLKTDRGYIDIEVRNSHNGYYGGTFEEEGEIFAEDLDAIENLTQVFEDF